VVEWLPDGALVEIMNGEFAGWAARVILDERNPEHSRRQRSRRVHVYVLRYPAAGVLLLDPTDIELRRG